MLKKIAAIFAVFILVSLCASLALCVFVSLLPIFENAKADFEILRIAKVAAFTLFQAVCSTLVALLIGIPAAFFTSSRNFFGRQFLLSLSAVPFCIPALIVALGYVSAFGISGTANKILVGVFSLKEPPLKFLYSLSGLILAQGFYNFPIAMKTVGDSWAKLPKIQSDAARLLGASEMRIFRTITIFELLPSIVSASLPIFIYSFMSFLLVLLFGAVGNSTLEVEIYRSAKIAGDLPLAARFALVETAIAVCAVIFQCSLEQKGSRAKGSSNLSSRKRICGKTETFFFSIFFALVFLFFIFPLFGIFLGAITSASKSGSFLTIQPFLNIAKFSTFKKAIFGTILTGICSSALCTIAGFAYASILAQQKSAPIKRALPMIPLAVSSVVLSIGISRIFSSGSVFALILAQSALNWPIAFRQIQAQISKIPQNVQEAAQILSKNRIDVSFRLHFPMCLRGILSAAGFCFALSAGDTTLPLVLSIPDFDTLALFTYRLAGAYRFHEACASGLFLGTICALLFSISAKFSKS